MACYFPKVSLNTERVQVDLKGSSFGRSFMFRYVKVSQVYLRKQVSKKPSRHTHNNHMVGDEGGLTVGADVRGTGRPRRLLRRADSFLFGAAGRAAAPGEAVVVVAPIEIRGAVVLVLQQHHVLLGRQIVELFELRGDRGRARGLGFELGHGEVEGLVVGFVGGEDDVRGWLVVEQHRHVFVVGPCPERLADVDGVVVVDGEGGLARLGGVQVVAAVEVGGWRVGLDPPPDRVTFKIRQIRDAIDRNSRVTRVRSRFIVAHRHFLICLVGLKPEH